MTPKRKPDADPKHDAEAIANEPSATDAGSRAGGLDELFGANGALVSRSDSEMADSRAKLAQLFGHTPEEEPHSELPSNGMTSDLDSFFGHDTTPEQPSKEPPAWEPDVDESQARTDESNATPDAGAPVSAESSGSDHVGLYEPVRPAESAETATGSATIARDASSGDEGGMPASTASSAAAVAATPAAHQQQSPPLPRQQQSPPPPGRREVPSPALPALHATVMLRRRRPHR